MSVTSPGRLELPCTLMRGGTSKGIILRESDLPKDRARRDAVILRLFGSPDRRQIDGLGGADPLTSKLAIVGPPTRAGADIDYSFAQIGIERAYVDYSGYCGNILAAVAAYAVDEGYVQAGDEGTASVRVHTTNANRIVEAEVPVREGRFRWAGDEAISGVPGTAATILLNFADAVGSVSGRLLPSGNPLDLVEIENIGPLEISVVDAGNPMVFARLSDFAVGPTEGPDEIDARGDLIERLEHLRRVVAQRFSLTMVDGTVSENIPLVALVAPPSEYTAYSSGAVIDPQSIDFIGREFFAGKLHKAYGIAETVCTAAAAATPGTLPNLLSSRTGERSQRIVFGHPSGAISVDVEREGEDQEPSFKRIAVMRTARRLMDGIAYIDGV